MCEVLQSENNNYIKQSFEPISNSETEVLVLGSLPGDKSLELKEYYGHQRNRFWRIISIITGQKLPINYEEKKALLLKTKIGVWDIACKANRLGSLDSAIKNEKPNDLNNFIKTHNNLKTIGFNGAKSELLFNKYFTRIKEIKYISLPSTSPANQTISFDNILQKWQQLVIS